MSNRKIINSPVCRGSFVFLLEPHTPKKGDPAYTITLMLDKKDPDHMKWLKGEAKDLVTQVGKDAFGESKFKKPFRDGDATDEDGDLIKKGFEGHWYVQAKTKNRPGIADRNMREIIDREEVYSGAWYMASITPFAWNHDTGGKGVSFALENVLKVKDDEKFGGRRDVKESFAGVDLSSYDDVDDAGDETAEDDLL